LNNHIAAESTEIRCFYFDRREFFEDWFGLTRGDGDSDESCEEVSFASLKSPAAELLDRRPMLRMLVLAEPDLLPREMHLPKSRVCKKYLRRAEEE